MTFTEILDGIEIVQTAHHVEPRWRRWAYNIPSLRRTGTGYRTAQAAWQAAHDAIHAWSEANGNA